MGFLSWLFPSDDDRMDKAARLIEQGEFHQARMEVEGLEGERAAELLHQAREGLKNKNLDLSRAFADSGEFDRAKEHIALASRFSDQKGDPDLRAARRALREARSAQRQQPKELTDQRLDPDLPEEADPLFSLPPDDPRVRFALLLESYPEALRERMVALGPAYAAAVLAISEGQPQRAVQELEPLTKQDPVAHFHRGQAAFLIGQGELAAEELRLFAQALGHQPMGDNHSASLLASTLSKLGRADQALQVLEQTLKQQPDQWGLQIHRAHVMESLQRFKDAEELAVALIRKLPKQLSLFRLAARCRIQEGKRMEAMQVLESGLANNCETGKCGSMPFDPESGAMLAQLYLEDRLDPGRAGELIGKLRRATKPGWHLQYLEALQARNQGAPVDGLVKQLTSGLSPQDPRRNLVNQSFAKRLT